MKAAYSIAILAFAAMLLTFCISCFYTYFYPMRYEADIRQSAASYQVDGALIAAVINVESGYNSSSKSSKGASGLMQLMPATAEWLCEQLQEPYSAEKLWDASFNIHIGSYYLAYLQTQFSHVDSVICAYNAGPGNVKAWLADPQYSSDGKTLKKIPFAETRTYLNRVHKNLRYYKNKYK